MDIAYKYQIESHAETYSVFKKWEEIVGQPAAKHVIPLSIHEHVLYLKTDGAAWMTEITMRKKQIIEKTNEQLGRQLIRDIRFKK